MGTCKITITPVTLIKLSILQKKTSRHRDMGRNLEGGLRIDISVSEIYKSKDDSKSNVLHTCINLPKSKFRRQFDTVHLVQH